jgi:hypothetical protein
VSGLKAGVLCRLVNPTHAESMQNKPVGERQSIGLEDCSVGIVDELVSGDAPRLVTNHSRAMLACGAGIVLIAMKDGLFKNHCSVRFIVDAVTPSNSFPISLWRA